MQGTRYSTHTVCLSVCSSLWVVTTSLTTMPTGILTFSTIYLLFTSRNDIKQLKKLFKIDEKIYFKNTYDVHVYRVFKPSFNLSREDYCGLVTSMFIKYI